MNGWSAPAGGETVARFVDSGCILSRESNGNVRCSPTVGVAIAAALAYSFVASTDYVCKCLTLLKITVFASTMTWVTASMLSGGFLVSYVR